MVSWPPPFRPFLLLLLPPPLPPPPLLLQQVRSVEDVFATQQVQVYCQHSFGGLNGEGCFDDAMPTRVRQYGAPQCYHRRARSSHKTGKRRSQASHHLTVVELMGASGSSLAILLSLASLLSLAIPMLAIQTAILPGQALALLLLLLPKMAEEATDLVVRVTLRPVPQG